MPTRTKRQKEVFEFITRYIETHGYEPSYQQIAWHLGVRSKAGIAKHIAALESQGLLTRRREDGSFGLEVHGSNSALESVCKIDWLELPDTVTFREIWEDAPLFVPIFMLGIYEPERIFAFRVQNDAMLNKNIIEGDIALIEKRTFVRDSDLIVAIVEKRRVVLKNYFRAGAKIELRPANNRYETIVLPADKIQILGVFRGLIRPLF